MPGASGTTDTGGIPYDYNTIEKSHYSPTFSGDSTQFEW